MAKKTAPLLPPTEHLLQRFGERLRLARLRRRLPARQVAERAGMTAVTLRNLERGSSGVTFGAYLAVMQVLGIEHDLDLLAAEDSLGRKLQDAALLPRSRVLNPAIRFDDVLAGSVSDPAPARDNDQRNVPAPATEHWLEDSDFVSADALASLLKPPVGKKRGKQK
jgi:transcriptional regulator with XRE-family HTH domain